MSTDDQESGPQSKKDRYDQFGILHMVRVFDQRLNELESRDMLKLIDRDRLTDLREKIAEWFIAVQIELTTDMMRLRTLPEAAFLKDAVIPDPNRLTLLYKEAAEARTSSDHCKETSIALEICVTSLLKLLMIAVQDLPRRNADGSFDRSHTKAAVDPLREHPYVLRNFRGMWSRLKRGLVDYLNARTAWLQAHGYEVHAQQVSLSADLSELFSQLGRAFYGDYLSTTPTALAAIRTAIIGALSLRDEIGVEDLLQLRTPALIESLEDAGFGPFDDTRAFVELVRSAETYVLLGALPNPIDEHTLMILVEQYFLHLQTTKLSAEARLNAIEYLRSQI